MTALIAKRLGIHYTDDTNNFPKGTHYAVVVFSTRSIFIPGDERSRTYPGRGYPERSETFDSHKYYFSYDLAVVEKFVVALVEDGRKATPHQFAVIHVDKRYDVQTNIKLE